MTGHVTSHSPEISPKQNFFIDHAKAYGASTHYKALGGGTPGADNDLAKQQADWYQQAYAYTQAVESGQIKLKPEDQQAYNEMLNQMQWVYSQLWGGQQGNVDGDFGPPGVDGNQEPQTDPDGGVMGPDGNWVYNEKSATMNYVGDETPHYSFAYNNTINVNSTSAKVTYEITSDGLNPAHQVLKVIVKDDIFKTSSVYYLENFDHKDFKLNINVLDKSQVTENPDPKFKKVTVGIYSGDQKDAGAESSVQGRQVGDWTVYDDTYVGDKIKFKSQGGTNQTHEVYADADIYTKNSDHIKIVHGTDDNTATSENESDPEGYTITVTHSDGTTDTYIIHKGFKVGLHAKAEYINWGNGEGKDTDVATGFETVFSLNGGVTDADDPSNPDKLDSSQDTKPTKKNGGVWSYDDDTVNVSATMKNTTSEIDSKNVTINVKKDQTVSVSDWDNEIWVTVGDGDKKTLFKIKKQNLENLDIKGVNEKNLHFTKGIEFDKRIQINGNPAAKTSPAKSDLASQLDGTTLPSTSDLNMGDDHGVRQWATDAVNAIVNGLKTGDWSDLESLFGKLNSLEGGWKNNGAEALFQMLRGILGGAGSGEKKLKIVIAAIPEELRDKWKQALKAAPDEVDKTSEIDGYMTGAYVSDLPKDWTHQKTINFIDDAGEE